MKVCALTDGSHLWEGHSLIAHYNPGYSVQDPACPCTKEREVFGELVLPNTASTIGGVISLHFNDGSKIGHFYLRNMVVDRPPEGPAIWIMDDVDMDGCNECKPGDMDCVPQS